MNSHIHAWKPFGVTESKGQGNKEIPFILLQKEKHFHLLTLAGLRSFPLPISFSSAINQWNHYLEKPEDAGATKGLADQVTGTS